MAGEGASPATPARPPAVRLAVLDPRLALAVTVVVAFVGLSFPYGVPLFTPLALWTLVCLLVHGRLRLPWNRGVAWLVAATFFLLTGALQTVRIEGQVRSDVLTAASVLLLLPALATLRYRGEFEAFLGRVWRYLAVSMGLVSLVALAKFWLLLRGARIAFFRADDGSYPWGSSLTVDYNFFAFGMFTGTVAALAVRSRTKPGFSRIALELVVVTTIAAGMLAGSRRYWAVAALAALAVLAVAVSRGLRAVGKWILAPRIARLSTWVVTSSVIALAAGYLTHRYGGELRAGLEGLALRLETMTTPVESLSSRLQRLTFAWELLRDYSVADLLLGRGFDYLTWFADRFVPYQTQDYPHNVVVAALLYSGLPGALAVVGFLADAALGYLRRWRRVPYLAVLFSGAILYIIPSMNSLFSAKFLPVLLVLPWVMPPQRPEETS